MTISFSFDLPTPNAFVALDWCAGRARAAARLTPLGEHAFYLMRPRESLEASLTLFGWEAVPVSVGYVVHNVHSGEAWAVATQVATDAEDLNLTVMVPDRGTLLTKAYPWGMVTDTDLSGIVRSLGLHRTLR